VPVLVAICACFRCSLCLFFALSALNIKLKCLLKTARYPSHTGATACKRQPYFVLFYCSLTGAIQIVFVNCGHDTSVSVRN
jgi:hypothetical protein